MTLRLLRPKQESCLLLTTVNEQLLVQKRFRKPLTVDYGVLTIVLTQCFTQVDPLPSGLSLRCPIQEPGMSQAKSPPTLPGLSRPGKSGSKSGLDLSLILHNSQFTSGWFTGLWTLLFPLEANLISVCLSDPQTTEEPKALPLTLQGRSSCEETQHEQGLACLCSPPYPFTSRTGLT